MRHLWFAWHCSSSFEWVQYWACHYCGLSLPLLLTEIIITLRPLIVTWRRLLIHNMLAARDKPNHQHCMTVHDSGFHMKCTATSSPPVADLPLFGAHNSSLFELADHGGIACALNDLPQSRPYDLIGHLGPWRRPFGRQIEAGYTCQWLILHIIHTTWRNRELSLKDDQLPTPRCNSTCLPSHFHKWTRLSRHPSGA